MMCDATCVKISTYTNIIDTSVIKCWFNNGDIAFSGWAVAIITIVITIVITVGIAIYTINETRKNSYCNILKSVQLNHYKICNKFKDMYTYRSGGIGNMLIIWNSIRPNVLLLLEEAESNIILLDEYSFYFYKSTYVKNKMTKVKSDHDKLLNVVNYFAKWSHTWEHDLTTYHINTYKNGLISDRWYVDEHVVLPDSEYDYNNYQNREVRISLNEYLCNIDKKLNLLNSVHDNKYRINQGHYNFNDIQCMHCMEYNHENAHICKYCGTVTDLGKYFPYKLNTQNHTS